MHLWAVGNPAACLSWTHGRAPQPLLSMCTDSLLSGDNERLVRQRAQRIHCAALSGRGLAFGGSCSSNRVLYLCGKYISISNRPADRLRATIFPPSLRLKPCIGAQGPQCHRQVKWARPLPLPPLPSLAFRLHALQAGIACPPARKTNGHLQARQGGSQLVRDITQQALLTSQCCVEALLSIGAR